MLLQKCQIPSVESRGKNQKLLSITRTIKFAVKSMMRCASGQQPIKPGLIPLSVI